MMTSDELRQKCIEAMALAISGLQEHERGMYKREIAEQATRTFDALHGLVYVNPIEAEEMKKQFPDNTVTCPSETFEAMAAAGDLTRPRKTP